jgi:transcriptional regulator with PAS, ATPase and Fis domain
LIEVNCAAVPKDLLESELFGYEPGAFTGASRRQRGLIEQAGGGTLFLDEIGELAIDLQAKVLRAIEERTIRRLGGGQEIQVDLQIITATNQDLDVAVEAGRFRNDLYHRLNVFRLVLPPLRERKEDLDELVPHLIAEFNSKARKSVKVVPLPVWEALRNHHWPGNVRELRNVIERGVLLANTEGFPVEWLQLGAPKPPSEIPSPDADGLWLPLDGSLGLEDMDRVIIETALRRHHYNLAAAARALHATRETVRYRVQKYGIKIPR